MKPDLAMVTAPKSNQQFMIVDNEEDFKSTTMQSLKKLKKD